MAKPRGMTVKDRTGQRYGMLTALWRGENHIEPSGAVRAQWVCVCDCGETHITTGHALARGLVKSCGCLMKIKEAKHGKAHSKVYRVWSGMKQRCSDPELRNFHRYGGRGISVCERWQEFQNFYADMGEPPPGYSLDRIDNDGDYTPENCRWASKRTQVNNTSRNRKLTYAGRTMTMADWGRVTGLGDNAIFSRLRLGWSVERALTEPLNTPSEAARLSHINRRKAPNP